jgi:hypothetical protein
MLLLMREHPPEELRYVGTVLGKVDPESPSRGYHARATGFIFALIEGFIVSLLFSGAFFYYWGPGLPIWAGISTIIKQMLYGIIFSAIGVHITPRYLTKYLQNRGR